MPGHTALLEKIPASAPRGARAPAAAAHARVSVPPVALPAGARARPTPGAVGEVQALQHLVGNQAVMRMLDERRPVQALREDEDEVQRAASGRALQGTANGPVVQRGLWDEWTPQFGRVAPKTERIARLGMAIVELLRRTGIDVRIGGSLSAAMFGGRRRPGDIDIDVPVESGAQSQQDEPQQTNLDVVKSRFMKLGKGTPVTAGNDLFFIRSLSKTSAGYRVEYLHKQTDTPLDPLEDDDQIETEVAAMQGGAVHEVNVDFSSEAIFTASGLSPDDQGAGKGYYGSEFLLAAYLNRLSGNLRSGGPDTKNDRGQITSLLERILSTELQRRSAEGPTGADDMRQFLLTLKASVLAKHVTEGNELLRSQVDQLFEEIIQEVVGRFYFT
ncbi:MAG: hypothetical protein ACJ8GN_05765 [Longimicrobiaceae bacterium]